MGIPLRAAEGRPAAQQARPVTGVVQDRDGKPIAGATVVVGLLDTRTPNHHVLKTDSQGRFSWGPPPGEFSVYLCAHKAGWSTTGTSHWTGEEERIGELKLRLVKPERHAATLVDGSGKPVAGATVKLEMIALSFENKQAGRRSTGVAFVYFRREVLTGSPLEHLIVTKTDARGAFSFDSLPPKAWLRLAVTTVDGKHMRTKGHVEAGDYNDRIMEEMGFVPAAGPDTRLSTVAAARVQGRVTTKLPGVKVAGLKVMYQSSRSRGGRSPHITNFEQTVVTDADGRFVFDDLHEGTVNIFVDEPSADVPWTYRAAQDVELKPGWTRAVMIELIEGVQVEGTVVAQGTGLAIPNAQVGVYGPYRPRSGAMTRGAKTDASGRFHYRLPSGETYFYVMGPPAGFTRLPNEGSSRTVTIPEGVAHFVVPLIEIVRAVTVRGRILDKAGAPVARAKIVGICQGAFCMPLGGPDTFTDAKGEFQLPPNPNDVVPVGSTARLRILLADGSEHEAAVIPGPGGMVTIKLPILGAKGPHVDGPADVRPDELAGVVVDPSGKPIEGVEVDAWTWYAGNETKTDARGFFRLNKLDRDRKVEVWFRKPGYTPQLFLTQPTGKPGWVVVLGNKTFFEGTVTDPAGKPVKNALIRANNGPKQADRTIITEIWTEATTDAAGRYRMYAQEDVYDIQVRVPDVGVARLPQTAIGPDETRHLDIPLTRGVVFQARTVDSETGEPVEGVRLWHWEHPGIQGRSGEDGLVTIPDMLPGKFNFQVEAAGFARWWSDQAMSPWSRRRIDEARGGWQRNFDYLDFDLHPGMEPVTIVMERGATIEGRVIDPDGHPVRGATVAPALSGTGNSLTGDTRFSVESDAYGRFTTILPASGSREYNLVAHDGKFQEWRTWANGVLPPFHTKPGEKRQNVEIKLTRPATVKGRVIDTAGHPIARREVRASAGDRLENRYYDPTTITADDGTFTLKFIRPGEQFIQVAPFWGDVRQAPRGTSKMLSLSASEVKEGVDFQVPAGERN
ncbi:MAG: carboxypeptidase regulatory-like domain-containing protein [Isosphaeraceae bacterium]